MTTIDKLDYVIGKIKQEMTDIKANMQPSLKRVTVNERAGRGTDEWLRDEIQEQENKLKNLEGLLVKLKNKYDIHFSLLINELLNN